MEQSAATSEASVTRDGAVGRAAAVGAAAVGGAAVAHADAQPVGAARATWAQLALVVGPATAVVAAAVLSTGQAEMHAPALMAFLVGVGATITGDRARR